MRGALRPLGAAAVLPRALRRRDAAAGDRRRRLWRRLLLPRRPRPHRRPVLLLPRARHPRHPRRRVVRRDGRHAPLGREGGGARRAAAARADDGLRRRLPSPPACPVLSRCLERDEGAVRERYLLLLPLQAASSSRTPRRRPSSMRSIPSTSSGAALARPLALRLPPALADGVATSPRPRPQRLLSHRSRPSALWLTGTRTPACCATS